MNFKGEDMEPLQTRLGNFEKQGINDFGFKISGHDPIMYSTTDDKCAAEMARDLLLKFPIQFAYCVEIIFLHPSLQEKFMRLCEGRIMLTEKQGHQFDELNREK